MTVNGNHILNFDPSLGTWGERIETNIVSSERCEKRLSAARKWCRAEVEKWEYDDRSIIHYISMSCCGRALQAPAANFPPCIIHRLTPVLTPI
jgi:hypothetical protein